MHFQKFMKRLRFAHPQQKIRFFHCGEYGEKLGRPHYHACLFNFDFDDKILLKKVNDIPLFTSPTLEKIWGKGFVSVGNVTFESAAYVARYIMKKINGDESDQHYEYINPLDGNTYQRDPEYTTMSRRPGIAHEWFNQFKNDVYPDDFIVINNRKVRPPRYYDELLKTQNPETFDMIKFERVINAMEHEHENTTERLDVKERILKSKLKHLPRNLEQ